MTTKTAPPPTPTITIDIDHPEFRRLMAAIGLQDAELEVLAGVYRQAAQDLSDVTKVHADASRRLETIDAALTEAAPADLDHLLTERVTAAGVATATAPARAGTQRRHDEARVAWLTRLKLLATAEGQAAVAVVEAAAAASRSDRMRLMQMDGSTALGTPEERQTLRARVISAAQTSEPARTRLDTCRRLAAIATCRLNQIEEARADTERRNRRG